MNLLSHTGLGRLGKRFTVSTLVPDKKFFIAQFVAIFCARRDDITRMLKRDLPPLIRTAIQEEQVQQASRKSKSRKIKGPDNIPHNKDRDHSHASVTIDPFKYIEDYGKLKVKSLVKKGNKVGSHTSDVIPKKKSKKHSRRERHKRPKRIPNNVADIESEFSTLISEQEENKVIATNLPRPQPTRVPITKKKLRPLLKETNTNNVPSFPRRPLIDNAADSVGDSSNSQNKVLPLSPENIIPGRNIGMNTPVHIDVPPSMNIQPNNVFVPRKAPIRKRKIPPILSHEANVDIIPNIPSFSNIPSSAPAPSSTPAPSSNNSNVRSPNGNQDDSESEPSPSFVFEDNSDHPVFPSNLSDAFAYLQPMSTLGLGNSRKSMKYF